MGCCMGFGNERMVLREMDLIARVWWRGEVSMVVNGLDQMVREWQHEAHPSLVDQNDPTCVESSDTNRIMLLNNHNTQYHHVQNSVQGENLLGASPHNPPSNKMPPTVPSPTPPSQIIKQLAKEFIMEQYLPTLTIHIMEPLFKSVDTDAEYLGDQAPPEYAIIQRFSHFLVDIGCVNHTEFKHKNLGHIYMKLMPLMVRYMQMRDNAELDDQQNQEPELPALVPAPPPMPSQDWRASKNKGQNDSALSSLFKERSSNTSSSTWSSGYSYRKELDSDDEESLDNALFYMGRAPLRRYKLMFDDMIYKWWGKYEFLEDSHDYIQSIFPIRERGMSSQQPLTKNEANLFRESPEMQERLIQSYEMMLDFYGLRLVDRQTGQVERAENWKDRFTNLNDYGHNYLRITRILKCLGICGLEHLKKPFLKHMFTEFLQEKQLPNIRQSLIRFWLPTLRREEDLIEVENLVHELTGKRISRRAFDKGCKEENWANTFYPIDPSEWDEGKTFYDRDENEPKYGDGILDSSYSYERSEWNRGGYSGRSVSSDQQEEYGSRSISFGGRYGGWYW